MHRRLRCFTDINTSKAIRLVLLKPRRWSFEGAATPWLPSNQAQRWRWQGHASESDLRIRYSTPLNIIIAKQQQFAAYRTFAQLHTPQMASDPVASLRFVPRFYVWVKLDGPAKHRTLAWHNFIHGLATLSSVHGADRLTVERLCPWGDRVRLENVWPGPQVRESFLCRGSRQ